MVMMVVMMVVVVVVVMMMMMMRENRWGGVALIQVEDTVDNDAAERRGLRHGPHHAHLQHGNHHPQTPTIAPLRTPPPPH